MKIKSLGHVVIRVSDVERAVGFYNGVLGLPVVARLDQGVKMAFFSLGNHHDFAVMQRPAGVTPEGETLVGLDHVAFKIGESLDELREAKAMLDTAGVRTTPIDHEVTKSLYMSDPDGNGVELYVDASDAWKREPQRVAQIAPLVL
ncbi:MAG TPA: VOC family protein [Gemmataceae bacterium]|nr:VOC family protein [Gemmataceae bacterium]